MRKTGKYLKKAVVFLVGSAVVIVGIILLPAPGPGMLVILFGLMILSTEFEWAERHLITVKAKMKAVIDKSKARADKFNKK